MSIRSGRCGRSNSSVCFARSMRAWNTLATGLSSRVTAIGRTKSKGPSWSCVMVMAR